MNDSNPKDRVSKAAWTLVQGIKDVSCANVVAAVRSGKIDVKPEHLEKLLAMISASIDEGYHKGTRVFERAVVVQQPAVAAGQSTKKKTA